MTPLCVLCLSQCSDVSFLTALVSNLAFLLFLEPGRQPERDYKTVNVDFSCIFMRHLSFFGHREMHAFLKRMDTISKNTCAI